MSIYTGVTVPRVRLLDDLCCKVLQCVVAVCCSVLQCVAECCSVLQCVAVCCSVLQCVAVWCSVLQRVAVCCSITFQYAVVTVFRARSGVCMCIHSVHLFAWVGVWVWLSG